jgi:hypothetical protein
MIDRASYTGKAAPLQCSAESLPSSSPLGIKISGASPQSRLHLIHSPGFEYENEGETALLEHPPSFHRPNQTVERGFVVPSPAIASDRI